ncbi:hypothetical protein ACFV7Q_22935 [Streptomyces sp. NPDC059851]|uniref:hypothetical protein n=1 Tax=Streptomyces sp. NPDC059851 TaxID=3346971 RepID=UPI0036666C75
MTKEKVVAMTDEKVERTGTPTRLKTAAGVAVGVVVALSLIALVWRTGWHIPFLTGWLSVKLGAKAGALALGGLVVFAAWRAKRRDAS